MDVLICFLIKIRGDNLSSHRGNISNREPAIYFNPWAAIDLPESLKEFTHSILKEDKMVNVEGLSLIKILEL